MPKLRCEPEGFFSTSCFPILLLAMMFCLGPHYPATSIIRTTIGELWRRRYRRGAGRVSALVCTLWAESAKNALQAFLNKKSCWQQREGRSCWQPDSFHSRRFPTALVFHRFVRCYPNWPRASDHPAIHKKYIQNTYPDFIQHNFDGRSILTCGRHPRVHLFCCTHHFSSHSLQPHLIGTLKGIHDARNAMTLEAFLASSTQ